MHDLGILVGILVILARFVVPLTIPKFPVPGLIASLVLDAVDQTIFQVTGTEFEGYQGYDKALDVYYLTVAYASTLRNWSCPWAFQLGRFLWYYRLLGVLLFELIGWRPLLLIFPNVFEYFFLAYELIRMTRRPTDLTDRFVTGIALFLLIAVKLPQETWIHVAQLDVTDEIAAHPTIAGACSAALLVLVLLLLLVLHRTLPKPAWPLTFNVDAHLPKLPLRGGLRMIPIRSRKFVAAIIEKTLLITLVSAIFAKILPGTVASDTQILLGTLVIVALNAVVSQFFARRGMGWATATRQFFAMVIVNLVVVLTLELLSSGGIKADVSPGPAIFLLVLLTFIVTLVDRYKAARETRWSQPVGAATAGA